MATKSQNTVNSYCPIGCVKDTEFSKCCQQAKQKPPCILYQQRGTEMLMERLNKRHWKTS